MTLDAQRSTLKSLDPCDPAAADWGFETLPTGNWFVSIPRVRLADAAVKGIGFLYSQYRALIELCGSADRPLLQPIIVINGEPVPWDSLVWTHERCWIPTFQAACDDVHIEGRLFAPIGERGFIWALEAWCDASADSGREIVLGWEGAWESAQHASHAAKPMVGSRHLGINKDRPDTVFLEFRAAAPLFALAMCASDEVEIGITTGSFPPSANTAGRLSPAEGLEISAERTELLSYRIRRASIIKPGEGTSLALHAGVGLKEASAVAAARDVRRRGWRDLLPATRTWLDARLVRARDGREEVVANRNMLYGYFFSQGICLDSEELALTSSRDTKSRWVAVYRDRDAMLRSMPGVLRMDPPHARRMLESAFTTQLRNAGVHSRFLDGAVLEPGFQLDQLCAPIQALALYIRTTRDRSILFDRRVQSGINHMMELLAARKHEEAALYSTVLAPNDEESPLPYVTYCNAMVWRALRDLAAIYDDIRDLDRMDDMNRMAEDVRRAIQTHCVIETPAGAAYAGAVDLHGNHALEDWPNASLKHLPLLEFCQTSDSVYRNTLKWISAAEDKACRSPEGNTAQDVRCSLVALLNDLMLGSRDARAALLAARLDDGIACEVIDTQGNCVQGVGNAALAGLLAYALRESLGQ